MWSQSEEEIKGQRGREVRHTMTKRASQGEGSTERERTHGSGGAAISLRARGSPPWGSRRQAHPVLPSPRRVASGKREQPPLGRPHPALAEGPRPPGPGIRTCSQDNTGVPPPPRPDPGSPNTQHHGQRPGGRVAPHLAPSWPSTLMLQQPINSANAA